MNHYGITFKDDGETISMHAEYFDINEGFVSLYRHEEGVFVAFAAYSADNVLHIVLQEENLN